MRNTKFSLKLSLVIMLLTAGIFAQSKNLSAEHWNLSEIDGSKAGAAKIFLEFDETQKRVTGSGGCNNLFGTISVSGAKIKFSDIGTTKMFCQQGKTALLEKNFLDTLPRITNYKKSGDTLTFYAGKKAVLKFQASAKTSANTVEQSRQTMNSNGDNINSLKLENKKWVFSAPAGAESDEITAGFAYVIFNGETKSANGDSGCYGFGGEYSFDGDKFAFTQTNATDRICQGEDRKNVSIKFMNGLQSANRFAVINGNLNLYRDQELLITLKNVE